MVGRDGCGVSGCCKATVTGCESDLMDRGHGFGVRCNCAKLSVCFVFSYEVNYRPDVVVGRC